MNIKKTKNLFHRYFTIIEASTDKYKTLHRAIYLHENFFICLQKNDFRKYALSTYTNFQLELRERNRSGQKACKKHRKDS